MDRSSVASTQSSTLLHEKSSKQDAVCSSADPSVIPKDLLDHEEVSKKISNPVITLPANTTNPSTGTANNPLPKDSIPISNLEKGLVGWESQDDPQMPLNFPTLRKWLLMYGVSIMTLISPLASSMFAPAIPFLDMDFHNTSLVLSSLTVSIFVLGYAVGPLLLAPLSEMYGRHSILTTANAFFCVWQLGCALAPNLGSLIVFRFLAGVGGAGCLTIGSGFISDLFRREQRGVATSLYSLGPLFGPVIGPIVGGFVAERTGWRWIFWILLIAGSAITIVVGVFGRETNPHVLIKWKTKRLQKELSRPELRSIYEEDSGPKSPSVIFTRSITRPLKMLFLSPIVAILALYMAVVYGMLYLLFTTLTTLFIGTYHWRPELTGLAYLGIAIGFFIGVGIVAKISDATVIRMTNANNGIAEPEMRLPACAAFACAIPISFFWYGWTTEYAVFWIVPIISLVPFGIGLIGIFIPITTYLIDCFPMYAASANAALTVSRSLVGALLPLAGPRMYDTLGYGWGNSVLGFIGVALIPAPALIYKFGGSVRKKYPIKL